MINSVKIESIEKAYLFFDSLITIEQKGIIQQAHRCYDLPYLKTQKKKAEEELKAKSSLVLFLGILNRSCCFDWSILLYQGVERPK